MKQKYMKRVWIKKIMSLMAIVVFPMLLAGCTNTSQVEDKSNMKHSNTDIDYQNDEIQDKAGTAGVTSNESIFIDEKLDENLFISAELKMPEYSLYEYSTELKNFDYDKVLETIQEIQENAEGTVVGEAGSFEYRRNDMVGLLDDSCIYAVNLGLADDRDLSFMSKADAVAQVQRLMEQLEVGGELEPFEVVSIDKSDFAKVHEDDDYQKELSARGYESDMVDDDLEVYKITFQMTVNGISVYRNEPVLQQTSDTWVAYPVTGTVLLSNNGIETITMIGMVEPYDEQQKEVAIIGEDGIKEAIMKKFGDVILTSEYKAVNIWMEYFPLLREGSFTDVDLIPVWCVDFETNDETVGVSQYTFRFNAITGEEIS